MAYSKIFDFGMIQFAGEGRDIQFGLKRSTDGGNLEKTLRSASNQCDEHNSSVGRHEIPVFLRRDESKKTFSIVLSDTCTLHSWSSTVLLGLGSRADREEPCDNANRPAERAMVDCSARSDS